MKDNERTFIFEEGGDMSVGIMSQNIATLTIPSWLYDNLQEEKQYKKFVRHFEKFIREFYEPEFRSDVLDVYAEQEALKEREADYD